ncbi:MAG: hypothetical protein K2I46_04150 [Clostridia bacterium]|nr:hypothetical protein [Clostridia bacterium]
MENVKKEDLVLYDEKSNNVATIKGAFGRFSILVFTFALCGLMILIISINDIANQYINKGVCDNYGILIYAIVLLAVVAIVAIMRIIMLKDPNLYFVGNDMYIKERKNHYLKISPQELDECGLMPYTSQNFVGARKTSKGYSSCSYWGYVNLVVNGNTYKVSCSSLKKAKHYIDGFMNGISVRENNFNGDPLRTLNIRTLAITVIVTSIIATFCYLMLDSANMVIRIISTILFVGSFLTAIILFIKHLSRIKSIRELELQYFNDFVANQPVKYNKSAVYETEQVDVFKESDSN